MTSKIPLSAMTVVLLAINGGTQTATPEPILEIIPADQIIKALNEAPSREGPLPDTPAGIPHQQHNQNAPIPMQEALRASAAALSGIRFEATPFSLSGSVGWRLDEDAAQGPVEAFIPRSLEFVHQHVPEDGSMHMLLPQELAEIALAKGWGIPHPFTETISGENSEYVMIFGPRNEAELKTIWIIAQISYYQARGLSMAPNSSNSPSSTSTQYATWGQVKEVQP